MFFRRFWHAAHNLKSFSSSLFSSEKYFLTNVFNTGLCIEELNKTLGAKNKLDIVFEKKMLAFKSYVLYITNINES